MANMLFRKLGVFQIQVVACIILQAVGCGGGSSETSQGLPDQGAEAINMLQLPPYVKFDISFLDVIREKKLSSFSICRLFLAAD